MCLRLDFGAADSVTRAPVRRKCRVPVWLTEDVSHPEDGM
jgi:hypothetical protein